MRVIDRQVAIPHDPGRTPLCGMIGYIDAAKPVLLWRVGYELSNDIHGGFKDAVSRDNGKTWSAFKPSLDIEKVDGGGFIAHTENAMIYLPERNLLVHFTNDKFESSLEGCNLDEPCRVRITVGEPLAVSEGRAKDSIVTDFGHKQGMCVSFCTPVRDSQGRILVPLQWQHREPVGGPRHQFGFTTNSKDPEVFNDYSDVGLLVGELRADDTIDWKLSQPVPAHWDKSSRGLCEPAVAELAGGRLVMIIRGSNAHWPERQGYKWVSYSSDSGKTWSEIEPLKYDDGTTPESSATGSAFFRSATDNRLYWIGNLCPAGVRSNGNWPRSPLYMARVREPDIAIERGTLTEIDTQRPGEDQHVQHSNFKFYQDRETGDVVIYLTRYGERGSDNGAWMKADQYVYRVAMK